MHHGQRSFGVSSSPALPAASKNRRKNSRSSSWLRDCQGARGERERMQARQQWEEGVLGEWDGDGLSGPSCIEVELSTSKGILNWICRQALGSGDYSLLCNKGKILGSKIQILHQVRKCKKPLVTYSLISTLDGHPFCRISLHRRLYSIILWRFPKFDLLIYVLPPWGDG